MNGPAKVRIGGIPYSIAYIVTGNYVTHDSVRDDAWGAYSEARHSIRIDLAAPRERVARSLLHEIIHGIIDAYRIRELRDQQGEHPEDAVDQLATGLAEALESMGVDVLGETKENK